MDREQIIKAIKDAASTLGVDCLTISAFRQQSGIIQSKVHMYFDSWSEACHAADISCGIRGGNLPKSSISEAECISELQLVADLLGCKALSRRQFDQHAKFTHNPVIQRFDSWNNALVHAGLEMCEQSNKAILPTREECVVEMKRVANLLGQSYLTSDIYDKHASISSYRVVRRFGSWHKALAKAGLSISNNYKQKIPLEDLANNFLKVIKEIKKIPTLIQLARRTKPVSHTYSGRFGGYDQFKFAAIEYLLSKISTPPRIHSILTEELHRLQDSVSTRSNTSKISSPHHQGRTLNFRAFTYAPTSEHDVVQMFGAVADELGFEIIGNRSAFPDCEARRKIKSEREHFEHCLIEYEFSSSDYKKHKHPLKGCDLIVCWQHNWKECPIEILELESAIRKLDGWR